MAFFLVAAYLCVECYDARGMSARTGKQESDKALWKLVRLPPTLGQLRGERMEEEVDEGAPLSSGRHWNKTVQGSPGAPGLLSVRLANAMTANEMTIHSMSRTIRRP